jgi:hypothetical protein
LLSGPGIQKIMCAADVHGIHKSGINWILDQELIWTTQIATSASVWHAIHETNLI